MNAKQYFYRHSSPLLQIVCRNFIFQRNSVQEIPANPEKMAQNITPKRSKERDNKIKIIKDNNNEIKE